MPPNAPSRKWLAWFLALVCSSACGNIDGPSRCQLDKASDEWRNNSFQIIVTNPPTCPVTLNSPGTNKGYAGNTTAPAIAVAEGELQYTEIADAFGRQSGVSSGHFISIGNGQMRSDEQGFYYAGQASLPVYCCPAHQDDQALTTVFVSPAVGGGVAAGRVLLPYTLSTGAIRTNVSTLTAVNAGTTLTMRGWNVASNIGGGLYPPYAKWYLDGVQFATTTATKIGAVEQTYIYEYSVPKQMNTVGTHTLKLVVGSESRTRTITVH